MATLVACRWAGAVLEKFTWVSGQELYARKAQKLQKVKWGPTVQPSNQLTEQPIDQFTNVV